LKIKSDVDLYVSTTWGVAITLKAGEVREVGDDLGYQALQKGAIEIKEVEAPAPKKKRGRPSKSSVKMEVTDTEITIEED